MKPNALHYLDHVDPALIDKAEHFTPTQRKHTFRRFVAVAACLCLCLCLTIPTLAAADNAFGYEILYELSPTLAQKLKPVHLSCEDQGIRMDVIAAKVQGDSVEILVSMTDETGERLDETTDLFDSYDIRTPHDLMGGCSLVEYRPETHTSVFLLNIQQMDHALLSGDKITFSIHKLLSQKQHDNVVLPQIDLANVPEITDCRSHVDMRGGSFTSESQIDFLPMAAQENVTVVPGVTLTGYGMAEGQLHVQLHYDDILHTDNHGFPYLKASDGEMVSSLYDLAFWDKDDNSSYEEYVFPALSDLSQYQLWGEFWTCQQGPIEGNWQITFPLSEK